MTQSCHKSACDINFLSELAPAESSWDVHRANTEQVGQLYAYSLDHGRYADRMADCSTILKYAFGKTKLILKQAFFCRVRFCPICQWRRSLMWRAVMFQKLDSIFNEHKTHRWIFVTLTVKNCEATDLRTTLKLMNSAWQRLTQLQAYKKGVEGSLRTTEVTRGKNGATMTHPHFHAMLLVKPSYFSTNYIKHSDWAEMWRKSLKADYTPSVKISAIRADCPEQLKKAICETLKYSVKPDDMVAGFDAGAWLHEVTKQTRNMRFIATGGALKGVLLPEKDISQRDMLVTSDDDAEDTTEKRIAFQYRKQHHRYVYAPQFNE